jgi:hypothetical protein
MLEQNFFSTGFCHLIRIGFMIGLVSQSVAAKPGLEPSEAPFNPEGFCRPGVPGITDVKIQQDQLTEPSLWWIRDQIVAQNKYGNRLVDRWLACAGEQEPNRVDLVVNAQAWSLLDFFDRYEFIQKFGTATTSFGYNLRVFDPQGELLAGYTCQFNSDVSAKSAEKVAACASFDNLARTNFWSPTKPTLEF